MSADLGPAAPELVGEVGAPQQGAGAAALRIRQQPLEQRLRRKGPGFQWRSIGLGLLVNSEFSRPPLLPAAARTAPALTTGKLVVAPMRAP